MFGLPKYVNYFALKLKKKMFKNSFFVVFLLTTTNTLKIRGVFFKKKKNCSIKITQTHIAILNHGRRQLEAGQKMNSEEEIIKILITVTRCKTLPTSIDQSVVDWTKRSYGLAVSYALEYRGGFGCILGQLLSSWCSEVQCRDFQSSSGCVWGGKARGRMAVRDIWIFHVRYR